MLTTWQLIAGLEAEIILNEFHILTQMPCFSPDFMFDLLSPSLSKAVKDEPTSSTLCEYFKYLGKQFIWFWVVKAHSLKQYHEPVQ